MKYHFSAIIKKVLYYWVILKSKRVNKKNYVGNQIQFN